MNDANKRLDNLMKAAVSMHVGQACDRDTRGRIRQMARAAVDTNQSATIGELRDIVEEQFTVDGIKRGHVTSSGVYCDSCVVTWPVLIELIELAIKFWKKYQQTTPE